MTTIYKGMGKGYFSSLMLGSIVCYRIGGHGNRTYSHMKFGVVIAKKNIIVQGAGQKHPFKLASLRRGNTVKNHMIEVKNTEGTIDFVQSKYAKVIIPPTAMTALLTFDDLKEIVQAMGKNHPTARSIVQQASHPADPEGKDLAVAEAIRFLDYVDDIPEPKVSKKIIKNYYAEEFQ